MYKMSIPEISNEELLAWYRRIKPIVDCDGIKYFLRDFKEDELRKISYLCNKDEDKREVVDMEQYVQIGEEFEGIHAYR